MDSNIQSMQKRMFALFGHGNISFHLAKLLEENGEMAQAIIKERPRAVIADEVADVVMSALLIAEELGIDDVGSRIRDKLAYMEQNKKYLNFKIPDSLDKRS
tara:strand:+ start:690 stop:995 length:306 start_codon:yes stop_codon:yes gene_type:complete